LPAKLAGGEVIKISSQKITKRSFNKMKRFTILLALLTIVSMACSLGGGGTSSEPASEGSDNASGASNTAKRGNAEFNITGVHQLDDSAAVAVASAVPGLNTLAFQIKTSVTGERAPAIIFLENIPSEPGSYSLSDLSLDDPQAGVHEAGVDIKDENASGVYPYQQFADAVGGTLTITGVDNNRISGNFEFTAQEEGESVTVRGAFQNVNLP
jgi:hypothetical protein